MLAKKFRLTGKKQFEKVQTEGSLIQSTNFGIAYLDRGDANPPRFAFIVSTKISKEATDRNTLKRHMSETVRLMTNEIKNGFDIVFLAKTSLIRVPADQIVREVRNAIRSSTFVKDSQ